MTKHPRIMRKQPWNVMEHEVIALYGCVSEHSLCVEAFDMQFEVRRESQLSERLEIWWLETRFPTNPVFFFFPIP